PAAGPAANLQTFAKAMAPLRTLPSLETFSDVLGEWSLAVTADADAWRMYEVWTLPETKR
ncbi:MAG TPA: hypothetical protein VIM58_07005, partial [Candidatus Methylacidiphilales bacterium]